jgi:hypothetical protein
VLSPCWPSATTWSSSRWRALNGIGQYTARPADADEGRRWRRADAARLPARVSSTWEVRLRSESGRSGSGAGGVAGPGSHATPQRQQLVSRRAIGARQVRQSRGWCRSRMAIISCAGAYLISESRNGSLVLCLGTGRPRGHFSPTTPACCCASPRTPAPVCATSAKRSGSPSAPRTASSASSLMPATCRDGAWAAATATRSRASFPSPTRSPVDSASAT